MYPQHLHRGVVYGLMVISFSPFLFGRPGCNRRPFLYLRAPIFGLGLTGHGLLRRVPPGVCHGLPYAVVNVQRRSDGCYAANANRYSSRIDGKYLSRILMHSPRLNSAPFPLILLDTVCALIPIHSAIPPFVTPYLAISAFRFWYTLITTFRNLRISVYLRSIIFVLSNMSIRSYAYFIIVRI